MCKILEKFCSLDETFGYVRFNINESLGKGKEKKMIPLHVEALIIFNAVNIFVLYRRCFVRRRFPTVLSNIR